MIDHLAPARVAPDEVATHVRDGADPDGEDGEIEVVADAQAPRGNAALVPVRLEVPALVAEAIPVHELMIVGARWPCRHPLDRHERLVGLAVADLRLHVEIERLDVRRVRGSGSRHPGDSYVPKPMEECEAHPAPPQHLVQRGEYDVSHAAAHLPEYGAAVGEERAEESSQGDPRRNPWALEVSIFVREAESVQPAQVSRVDGTRGGAVQEEPLATVVVVDRVEAARIIHEPEANLSPHGRERQVDDLPDPPQLGIVLESALEEPPRVRDGGVQEPHEDGARIVGERGDHDLEQCEALRDPGERGELAVMDERRQRLGRRFRHPRHARSR